MDVVLISKSYDELVLLVAKIREFAAIICGYVIRLGESTKYLGLDMHVWWCLQQALLWWLKPAQGPLAQ